MTSYTIGADISKDFIDLHRFPEAATLRVANDKAGFKAILKWIGKFAVTRIVYEPTGAYHKAFEVFMVEAGVPLSKVNPKQARRFAEATGKLVKTDRVDGAMLTKFGVALEPRLLTPHDKNMYELKDLERVSFKWNQNSPQEPGEF